MLAERIFDSIGAMMLAYSEEAVRLGWNDHRQRLDWTESSVAVLETILAGQAAEDLEFQTRLWGSYFGEVIRRSLGGEWALTQYPGGHAAVPTLVIGGSRLYPLMKVYRRLTLGETENVADFYRLISLAKGN
jgi:hypothetical protein